MPPSLRTLYETGEWRHHNVYLWPRVLALSNAGHALADAADAALDRLRFHPTPSLSTHPVSLTETAIRNAASAAASVSSHVRDVLTATQERRIAVRRRNARAYMIARRQWMDRLVTSVPRDPDSIQKLLRRDRQLLIATRASAGSQASMTDQEVDVIFGEIDAAGGTAGGIERWGRSITAIPDHHPHQLPPAADGGGVLIDNPLAAHYAARNINPWTRTERLLFLEKFLLFGKNFRKVATFFEHKSCEDVVRFYFDNKKQLKLKQLVKENNIRKKGNKKTALIELSMMPHESRSIKDNFIHQEGFDSDDETDNREFAKAEKLSQGTVGRGWSPADRRSLIFALCRVDVSSDDESEAAPSIWTNIAALVGSKTPRQCRQFYFEYKSALGLDGYRPPVPQRDSTSSPISLFKRTERSPDPANETEPRTKQAKRDLGVNGAPGPTIKVVSSTTQSRTLE